MRFSELGGGPPLIDGRARGAIVRPARRTGSPDPHDPEKALRRSSRMLKNSFTPRLLKKVQMQGGAPGTHPQDGCRCEAYLRVRRSAARARQRGRWAFLSSLLGQGQMIVVEYPESFEAGSAARGGICTPR